MGSFSLSGGVEVFGFISPSNTTDQYPVIDPLYGIDGLRNVNTLSDLDLIPTLRRRAGMLVGVSGGTVYYKLKDVPWNNTIADWELFELGSNFTGGTVTGATIFTNGLTANTISATTYENLPLDIFVTGGTFSGGSIVFTNNSGGTFNVSGISSFDTFITGFTYSSNTLTIEQNSGSSFNVSINDFTGLTINGDLNITGNTVSNSITATTVNATNLSGTPNFLTKFTPNSFSIGDSIVANNSNNVTVGSITTPYRFYVLGVNSTVGQPLFVVRDTGRVGINTTAPTADLSIVNTNPTTSQNIITLRNNGTGIGTGNAISFINSPTPSSTVGSKIESTITNLSGRNILKFYVHGGGGAFGGLLERVSIDGTGLLTAPTISATTYLNLPIDVFVTGGTFSGGDIIFTNNTGGTFNVSGISSFDTFVTGFTYNDNTFTIEQNSGSTLSATINSVTGLTSSGTIQSSVISATTYQNLPTDIRVTGGTYTTGTATFTNNTGGTFNVTGFVTGDTFVTGLTFNNSNYNLTITRNDGVSFTDSLSILASDLTITGGTYNSTTGTATFTNNTGGTFNVTGFLTGFTDIYVTGGTYSAGTLTFTNTSGGTFSVSGLPTTTTFTGGTVTGSTNFTNGLSANTISATTYQNLPTDIRVTGATYSNNTFTFRNNTGGTFNVLFNTVTGLTSTGTIQSSVISATTYQNLPTDVRITGGTLNKNTDTITFTNNTGGTFNVTGVTDTFVTGATFSGTSLIISQNENQPNVTANLSTVSLSGALSSVTFNIITTGGISASTISATTYQNLPTDIRVTGGTYSNGTATFTNNTGGTFNVSGFFTGSTEVFVTGASYSNNIFTYTNNTGGTFNVLFNNVTGLTSSGTIQSNILSATTYQNLPTDVFVTGGTFGGGSLTFTNNTGGTFNVSGISSFDTFVTGFSYNNNTFTIEQNSGSSLTATINIVTGLTVNGDLIVTGTTSSGIISATTYQNLPTDVFVTGGTYDNGSGTATFTNNTGGTFNVVGFSTGGGTFTGGTVTGPTIFTNGLSANTISATTYLNLPIDVFVTGGTYNNGDITFTNNTGGTFNVSGLFTGSTDVFVTGGTYSNGDITFTNNTGGTFNVSGLFTGSTDVFVTGGTYSNGDITFTNNTGGTFNVSGLFTGNTDVFVTGGTFDKNTETLTLTNVTGGTISITGFSDVFVTGGTYSNGDITFTNNTGGTFNVSGLFTGGTDVFVTGGTYSNGTATFTNNTGGTFNVVGFFTGGTDVFVTGASYNNNTFTYTNNTGGTFNVLFNTVTGLTVNGNLSVTGTTSSGTISATTYQNLPTDIRVTGASYSNNTFTFTNNTGGTFSTLFNTVTGLTVNGNLSVTGNTNVRGLTGTTALISGSGQNILTIVGSGSTQPLFTVQGSSGELFSITDSLTGSLFSVNDISGLPILEVFSDNTILMGNYLAPSLYTTTRVLLSAGTNTIYSIPTSAYTGAFFEYTLISSGTTGARSGNIMSIWSGSSVNFTETQTTDIGTTTGVTFNMGIVGSNAVLSSSATTAGWTVKTIIKSI